MAVPSTVLTIFQERYTWHAPVKPSDQVAMSCPIDTIAEFLDPAAGRLFIEAYQLTCIRPQRGFEIQGNKRNRRPLRNFSLNPDLRCRSQRADRNRRPIRRLEIATSKLGTLARTGPLGKGG